MTCQFCHIQLPQKNNSKIATCSKCKLTYFVSASKRSYQPNYFANEYKEQYGKTYLEDENSIRKRSKIRLQQIQKFIDHAILNPSLLELGSAAGFFLSEAQKVNFTVQGWEISKEMSTHANRHELPTKNGDILDLYAKHSKTKEKFDVICAFYVIEHFRSQDKIWHILKSLVKKGGLLILATPSTFGPSRYFHFKRWLELHPKDHFVDYSPTSMLKIANYNDFEAIHFSVEGVHAERIPLGNKPVFKYFYRQVIKKFVFSDTMLSILRKR